MKHLAILLALLAVGLTWGASGPATAFGACSVTAPCTTTVAAASPLNYTDNTVKVFGQPFTPDQAAHARTFYAECPNSGTWTASIGILCSHEGQTWAAGTGDTIKFSISNSKTDTDFTPANAVPCTIYGMYMTKTGTITAAGSTNGRSGVIVGVNGGF